VLKIHFLCQMFNNSVRITQTVVIWTVTPHGLIGGQQQFRRIWCLRLQGDNTVMLYVSRLQGMVIQTCPDRDRSRAQSRAVQLTISSAHSIQPWGQRLYIHETHWYPTTKAHHVTTYKTTIQTLTAMKTWQLINVLPFSVQWKETNWNNQVNTMSQKRSSKIKVFCDVKPCSLVGRTTISEESSASIFRKEYCLITEAAGSSEGVKKGLYLSNCTVSQHSRLTS
jgi:hypothetical protein